MELARKELSPSDLAAFQQHQQETVEFVESAQEQHRAREAIVRKIVPAWDGQLEMLMPALLKFMHLQPSEFYKLTIPKLDAILEFAATTTPADPAPTRFPADHYNLKYGIPATRLESARRGGRLKKSWQRQQHGRWFYDDAEVRASWPEDFIEDSSTPPPG